MRSTENRSSFAAMKTQTQMEKMPLETKSGSLGHFPDDPMASGVKLLSASLVNLGSKPSVLKRAMRLVKTEGRILSLFVQTSRVGEVEEFFCV